MHVVELVIVEPRQRLEVVVAHDLVEPRRELGIDITGRQQLRKATEAGSARAVGQDLGQLADQVGQVAGLGTVAPPLQLRADDVEPTLHEPAQVRQAGLDLLAFGPHRAHVGHRATFELSEILGAQDAIELGRHQH